MKVRSNTIKLKLLVLMQFENIYGR